MIGFAILQELFFYLNKGVTLLWVSVVMTKTTRIQYFKKLDEVIDMNPNVISSCPNFYSRPIRWLDFKGSLASDPSVNATLTLDSLWSWRARRASLSHSKEPTIQWVESWGEILHPTNRSGGRRRVLICWVSNNSLVA